MFVANVLVSNCIPVSRGLVSWWGLGLNAPIGLNIPHVAAPPLATTLGLKGAPPRGLTAYPGAAIPLTPPGLIPDKPIAGIPEDGP